MDIAGSIYCENNAIIDMSFVKSYAQCCMNGSGHLQEDYRQPIHLCPVDLKKMQEALKFDVWQRYEALLKFFEKYEMKSDAQWIREKFHHCNHKLPEDVK